MVGNKNSGNPNVLADTRGKSTGPKTIAGKIKATIMGTKGVIIKENSRLINSIRRCDKCPLGPKDVIIKGMEVRIGAVCKFFKKDSTKCLLPMRNFAKALETLYLFEQDEGVEERVTKAIMESALGDAYQTKPIEIMKKGHAAGYTEMHEQRALKAAEVLHKMKYGEKRQNLNVNVDLSHEIVEAFKKRVKEDKEVVEAEIQEQEAKK